MDNMDAGNWVLVGPVFDGTTSGELFGSIVALLQLDHDGNGIPDTAVMAVGAPFRQEDLSL